jgi:hypothetical protein
LYAIGTFNEKEFDDQQNLYLLHAIFLLTELKSKESLPVLLEVFRQSDEFHDAWFRGEDTFILWEPVVFWGKDQLPLIAGLLKEPHLDTFNRAALLECVMYMHCFFPQKKTELEQWHKDLLLFFIQNRKDRTVVDSVLNGLLIRYIVKQGLSSLLPLIKQMFDLKIVDKLSNYESVEEGFPEAKCEKPEIMSLSEKYTYLQDVLYGDDEVEDIDDDFFKIPTEPEEDDDTFSGQPYIAPAKAGRNDPCPCGSGKKYKKCCGK